MRYRGYSAEEADMAVYDFPDPYNNTYLVEEFEDYIEVDGIEYERNSSYTDLTRCGIDHVPPFKFYTLYQKSDIPNHKVIEYMNAQKLFEIDASME